MEQQISFTGSLVCVYPLALRLEKSLWLASFTIRLWMSCLLVSQGKGAFLNGEPIKVSSQSELVTALLVTEAGIKRDQATLDDTTDRINSLLTKVRSLRMIGSCALDLCSVACGRVDIFYELGFGGPWDIAAGIVIVREAGGLIFDPSGKDLDITSQRIAASNAFLKELFVEALQLTKA